MASLELCQRLPWARGTKHATGVRRAATSRQLLPTLSIARLQVSHFHVTYLKPKIDSIIFNHLQSVASISQLRSCHQKHVPSSMSPWTCICECFSKAAFVFSQLQGCDIRSTMGLASTLDDRKAMSDESHGSIGPPGEVVMNPSQLCRCRTPSRARGSDAAKRHLGTPVNFELRPRRGVDPFDGLYQG